MSTIFRLRVLVGLPLHKNQIYEMTKAVAMRYTRKTLPQMSVCVSVHIWTNELAFSGSGTPAIYDGRWQTRHSWTFWHIYSNITCSHILSYGHRILTGAFDDVRQIVKTKSMWQNWVEVLLFGWINVYGYSKWHSMRDSFLTHILFCCFILCAHI